MDDLIKIDRYTLLLEELCFVDTHISACEIAFDMQKNTNYPLKKEHEAEINRKLRIARQRKIDIQSSMQILNQSYPEQLKEL